MQGEHSSQNSFFGMIYEDLIPADHLLCKLAATFVFVTGGQFHYLASQAANNINVLSRRGTQLKTSQGPDNWSIAIPRLLQCRKQLTQVPQHRWHHIVSLALLNLPHCREEQGRERLALSQGLLHCRTDRPPGPPLCLPAPVATRSNRPAPGTATVPLSDW